MSKYLIDTDICIAFLKDKFNIKRKIKSVGISNCYISEITIAELTYGAYKSSNFEKHISEVVRMKNLFNVIPISDSIEKYAAEKVRLQRLGQLIPDFDLLIATSVVAHNMVIVTRNEKHFSRINDIVIENWTKREFNHFA
ncbi:MAG: type II toxin-antitoxin system VapC family toxin [Chitinophagales bacterium]